MNKALEQIKNLFLKINTGVLLVTILAFILGWQLGHKDVELKWQGFRSSINVENKEPPRNINIDFKLFWDTWDLVNKHYFDKSALDPTKMFYGAVQGMVAAIGDPYTVFLPPTQQKVSKEELNGSFEGVGIQLGFNQDKRLVVMSPLSGSPAEKAGIQPEDIIVRIDGKDTSNMTLPQAVEVIRGPKGTEVVLTIFREGDTDTKDYTLIRDTIIVKSVELSYKDSTAGKKIAHIKLTRFGERTEDEWNQSITDVISKNAEGVVLDVRNNPGGYLEGAVFIASEFLDGGDVVLQENNRGERMPYRVNRSGKLLKLPMVVLINKGSASASEIVAGALQDRDRAELVGTKSFGKGTIQEAQELPGGTGIHITVAKWLTPKGSWVNDSKGLEPDVKIEMPKPENGVVDATKDPQFDKALELLD
ncbi:S41 family peptidase [Candidatus Daviesbacteria bacterium]|nr:S41 family peptidase [Candidatus Daviesbacteria bacterium]